MQRRHIHRLAAPTLVLSCPLVCAQTSWPDKPVKWVLSQPPGSGPDNLARVLSERLAKS